MTRAHSSLGLWRARLWRLVALVACVWAPEAAAQEIPIGPGLDAQRDTVRLDAGAAFVQLRPPIAPRSVKVDVIAPVAQRLAPEAYRLDLQTGALRLVAPFDTLTTLVVAYRRLPSVALPPPLVVLTPDTTGRQRPRTPTAPASGGSTLATTGSITRGVVAGSNRDVSLTSGLRLDVSGEVAPGVTVTGALTDSDTPIVPEGTTQTLSDFDRVFVRVDGPGAQARLGDIDLRLDGTAFAPLRRTVQGAVLDLDLPARGLVTGGRVQAGASAVRGRFRSQDLVLRSGVQGPYRLEGDRGEPFVLVVPGSERVYVDGRALLRGREYTVDYGTGEITFTPEVLITAERRATVDFEFSAGGYARTLSAASASVGLGGSEQRPLARVGGRVLREADAPGLGDALGLSEDDLDRIAASGASDVLVPGEVPVAFDAESAFVLYTARDTTLSSGATERIFVPATAEADSVFRVRFSRVRAGEGSYRRAGQAINGILYEWVGLTGGDYVPFRILPRPASRTVLDLFAEAEPIESVVARVEVARSIDDVNTLSSFDARGQDADALEASLDASDILIGEVEVQASLVRRVRARGFRTLDRIRTVDYNRRWNLARAGTPFGSEIDSLGEAVTEATLSARLEDVGSVRVTGGTLGLGAFNARRVGALATLDPGVLGDDLGALPLARVEIDAVESDAGSTSVLGSGSFLRQRLGLRREILGGRLTPLLDVENERRRQSGGVLPQDSLLSASYSFLSVRPGLAFDLSRLDGFVSVEVRDLDEPLAPRSDIASDLPLAPAARALGAEAQVAVQGAAGLRSDARVAYRRTRYRDAFVALGREDEESLAVGWTARASPLARALSVRTRYEALTERSPVLQEAYVLVGPEAGLFVWRDGEGEPRAGEPDGVQQVDEFFPETTPFEGTYVRTFVPSDDLVPSVGASGRLALRLDGARLADGMGAEWARRFSARGTVEVREKSASGELLRVLLFDPGVLQQRADTTAGTIDGRFRAEGELSFRPTDARNGLRLGLDHLTTTRRLAAGAETRRTQLARLEGRVSLAPTLLGRLSLRAERRETQSRAFASRTFDLRALTAEPSVTWATASGVSLTAGAVVSSRVDRLASGASPEAAFLVRVPVDVRWAPSAGLSVTGRAELSFVDLSGGEGTGLSLYELTDGRGPGTSGLGGVQAVVALTESVRATLTYDGRLPATSRLVQTVRASVSAVF